METRARAYSLHFEMSIGLTLWKSLVGRGHGLVNAGVIYLQMFFKALKLDEISKEAKVKIKRGPGARQH